MVETVAPQNTDTEFNKIFLSAKILVNLHDLQSLAKLVNMFFNSFGVCVICACVYVSLAHAQWSSGVLFSHSISYSLVQVLLVNLELDC